MDFLRRQHLIAAARSLHAGRQTRTAVDALEAARIPSEKAVLLHLHRKRMGQSLSERFASVKNENGHHGRPGWSPCALRHRPRNRRLNSATVTPASRIKPRAVPFATGS